MTVDEMNGPAVPGWWTVLSPEYTYTEPVMDDGSGPRSIERDYLLVEAPTKRKAISRAVAYWLRSKHLNIGEFCLDQRGSRENPYRGITAEPAHEYAVANRHSDARFTVAATTPAASDGRAESRETDPRTERAGQSVRRTRRPGDPAPRHRDAGGARVGGGGRRERGVSDGTMGV